MILKNALIVDGDFKLVKRDLEIAGEKILKIEDKLIGDEILDLDGCYIMPGFIDTHIHGANGTRISDEDSDISRITRFEVTQGVTGIAITTASSKFDRLIEQIDCAVKASKNIQGTKILGIHAEGPFLNRKRKGAMNADNLIAPNAEMLDQMILHGKGLLKIITIAPEIEMGLDLISYASDRGLVVSMGHTDATYEEAQKGIEAGATQLTHAFNAARPYNHREPGVLGTALLSEKIKCEMICDYVHLHPATVQMIYRLKGAEKINMISDSGHAAGLTISEFDVDGVTRYVKDGVVRLADGTIAGSAMTLLDGVKHLLADGIPMTDIARMASYNPAQTLGISELTGSIEVGKYADLVVLDKNYNVLYTFVNGKCEFRKEDKYEGI